MLNSLLNRLRSWEGLLLAILAGVVAFNVAQSPFYLGLANQINLFQLSIEKIIVALAMTFIIINGEIDLSVASVMGLAACLLAWLYAQGVPLPLALLAVSPNWPLSRAREPAFQAACEQIRPALAPGATVLAPDIGVLGWCLDQALILDAAGLVSPEALPYLQPGQAVAPELVADFQPTYVVALEQFLKPALLADPGFQADYELIWQQPVTIAGVARPLYIFRRRSP